MRRLLSTLVFLMVSIVVWNHQKGQNEVNARFIETQPLQSDQTKPTALPLITGTSQKWHPLTFSFVGPAATETDQAPNPFLDYRFTLNFTAPSGREIQVPGFFDGNGQGAGSGDIWRVRFAPDELGEWQYRASFRQGTNLAIDLDMNAGSPTSFDNSQGTFTVVAQGCYDPGFLKWGRLEYTGAHYLKFNDGPYWIKGGTNSPENLLGYKGFDNTIDQGGIVPDFVHEYPTHSVDWRAGDPDFSSADTGYDSKALIGALNYLASQHINSIYFLPMNLGGDGQETYPFIDATNDFYAKTHYDISKLNQWNIVFEHAQRQGIALHVMLAETEIANEQWLDGGQLGIERKLFYREIVARFGYLLAIKWNLSEENDYPVEQLQQFAGYIQALDWAEHPIGVHSHLNDERYYQAIKGDPRFTSTSFQYDNYDVAIANDLVENWRQLSTAAGRPWIIDMDENLDSLTSWNEDQLRINTLYPVYFSGGNIEWYLGYHNLPLGGDLRLEDFRTREKMWRYTWYARQFMLTYLPFWEMVPLDHLLQGEVVNKWGEGHVFAKPGEVYAVYIPEANGEGFLNMQTESGNWRQRWYDPRTGQLSGEAAVIVAGGAVAMGTPPYSIGSDWVVLLEATPPAQSVLTVNPADSIVYLPLIKKMCPVFIE